MLITDLPVSWVVRGRCIQFTDNGITPILGRDLLKEIGLQMTQERDQLDERSKNVASLKMT